MDNYNAAHAGGGQLGIAYSPTVPRDINPTMRENIESKIKWHKDEIERLENIKGKLPQLLDVNLRDLREAMNF